MSCRNKIDSNNKSFDADMYNITIHHSFDDQLVVFFVYLNTYEDSSTYDAS